MIFTAGQLVAHLWGDYILQSDWMATKKTKDLRVAMVHAIVYMLPFAIFLRPSTPAWTVMLFTHAFIDRYRLARYVVWAKNWIGAPRRWVYVCLNHVYCAENPGSKCAPQWEDFDAVKRPEWNESQFEFYVAPTPPLDKCPTGYPPASPVWLSVWLLIIADNILHITINGLAMRYL